MTEHDAPKNDQATAGAKPPAAGGEAPPPAGVPPAATVLAPAKPGTAAAQESEAPREEVPTGTPRDAPATAAPSPAPHAPESAPSPRRSWLDLLAEAPEETVEVPRGRLAAQSRRDFILFSAGVVASALGAWWLLPEA